MASNWWEDIFGSAKGAVATLEVAGLPKKPRGKTPEELEEEERKRRQAELDAQMKAAKTREEAQVLLGKATGLDVSGYNLDVMFPQKPIETPQQPVPQVPEIKPLEIYQEIDAYAGIRNPITGVPEVKITSEDIYLQGIRDLSERIGMTVDFPQLDISQMSTRERRIYRENLREAYRSMIHYEHDVRMGYVPEGWGVKIKEPSLEGFKQATDAEISNMTPEQRQVYYKDLEKQYRWGVDWIPDEYGFSKPEPKPQNYGLAYTTPGGWEITNNQVISPEGQELTDLQAKNFPGIINRLSRELNQTDIAELRTYAETNPDEFIASIRQAGDTPLTRATLTRMGYGDAEIQALFPQTKQETWWQNLGLEKARQVSPGVFTPIEQQQLSAPTEPEDVIKQIQAMQGQPLTQKQRTWLLKEISTPLNPVKSLMDFLQIPGMFGRLWGEGITLPGRIVAGIGQPYGTPLGEEPYEQFAARTQVPIPGTEKLTIPFIKPEEGLAMVGLAGIAEMLTPDWAFTGISKVGSKFLPEAVKMLAQGMEKQAAKESIMQASKLSAKEAERVIVKASQMVGANPEVAGKWADIAATKGLNAPELKALAKEVARTPVKTAETIAPKVPEVAPKVEAIVPKAAEVPIVKGIDDISDITTKVKTLLTSANKARLEQQALRKPEQAARFGSIQEIRQTVEDPIEAAILAKSKLKGELPKGQWPEFEAVQFAPEDVSRLIGNAQKNPNITEAEFVRISEAFKKMAEFKTTGKLLQKNEIDLLKKAFLIEIPKSRKAQRLVLDILNIPRSSLASIDHSMVLRQTILLAPAYPKTIAKAAWQSFAKSFRKLDAEDIMRAVTEDADYKVLSDHGMSFTEWGVQARKLPKREEQFSSSIADKIPWVNWSNRLATNYLNLVRLHIGKKGLIDLEHLGLIERVGGELVKGDGILKQWTRIVNAASGRGELGVLSGSQPFLNAVLFSPRLQAARLQIPYYYGKVLLGAAKGNAADRYLAKEMTRMIGSFVAFATTFLGLCKLAGAKVETDPRSSDFGKAKFGNTRISVAGGFEQYIRLAARLISGQAKTSSGQIVSLADLRGNRWQEIGRFTEMKYAPIFSIVRDIMAGENVIGEPIEFTPKGIGKQVYQRTVAMFIQDMIDSFQDSGITRTLLIAPLTFLGGLVQTYAPPSPPTQLASQVAALKRDEDKIQKLIRQGEIDKAREMMQSNSLLDMFYDANENDYYSRTRRALQSQLAKVNQIKADYNKINETKMDKERKDVLLKQMEDQMNTESQKALDWLIQQGVK